MRNMAGVVMAAAAAVGACAGDPLARQDIETRSEPQPVAARPRFVRSPVTGPIHTAVVPRAADPAAMTVVAVLGGPSVADLQEAAARKLTRAEKAAIKAQRIAEQAAPRAQIEAAGGAVIGSFQSALDGLKVRIPRNRIAALPSRRPATTATFRTCCRRPAPARRRSQCPRQRPSGRPPRWRCPPPAATLRGPWSRSTPTPRRSPPHR